MCMDNLVVVVHHCSSYLHSATFRTDSVDSVQLSAALITNVIFISCAPVMQAVVFAGVCVCVWPCSNCENY